MTAGIAPALALLAAHAGALRAPGVDRLGLKVIGSRAIAAPFALDSVATKLPDLRPDNTAVPVPPQAVLATAVVFLTPMGALAKEGQYGFLEKKLPALVHPVIMGLMFLVSLNAAYTGLQWRRLRGITGQVNTLKAELKPLQEKAAAAETPDAALVSQMEDLGVRIASLTATRSSLSTQNLRDSHWQTGSVLLGIGTSFAIEGPVNTYMRAGKLFPGPHLYAGAGCVVLWAMAAALAPQMQKGSDGARIAHIVLNVAGLSLFIWQLPTGFDILGKVWTKVPW